MRNNITRSIDHLLSHFESTAPDKQFDQSTGGPQHHCMKPPLRASILACTIARLFAAQAAEPDANGFVSLFDGKSLNGWHVSAKTGHSRASKNQSGGKWVIENGVIIGSQDIPGNGGIIITDEQFGNFEVVLEMNNDSVPIAASSCAAQKTARRGRP
jgi:hypothetical protein